MIQLTRQDFDCIGLVAKHCNNKKLCIATNEASNFDLKPLLCNLYLDIQDNWNEISGAYFDLINGSDYTDCNGKTKHQAGLKKVLIYYAYARYVIINNFDDTPNGGVTKTNEFSIPKPFSDLRAISNKYKNMAEWTWENEVKPFLCHNKTDYPNFNDSGCEKCGCGSGCKYSKQNTKRYGIVGKNIGE